MWVCTYHFIHLTLQEYLAAVHISQLLTPDQTRLAQEHFNSGQFKMTIRFFAGLIKSVTRKRMVSNNNKPMYFHILFEAKGSSLTTRDLRSDEMIVNSHYSWTPLDYRACHLTFQLSLETTVLQLFHWWWKICTVLSRLRHPRGNWMQTVIANIPYHMLPDMKELDLSHNKLDGSACNLLAEVVPSMSSLEELWLSYNVWWCCESDWGTLWQ